MNIAKQNIDDLNAVIRMTIDKADYESKVNDVLENYRKKANMPGFRPGKVPAGIVRKLYGKAILVDEVNKLVSESISNYISENHLEILGEPLPSAEQKMIDFDTMDSFEFSFDIALAPEFEAKLSKKDKLPYYSIKVTEEMLDQQIKSVTGRFGKTEKVEKVSDKSMVKGTFEELDANGNLLEGGIRTEDAVISLMVTKDEKEKKKLLNASVGSVVVFDPKIAFPNDTEISYILKISKEQAQELKSSFRFTITDITEFVHAELTQDLFNQLYGEGVINSEEEFKNKVKEDLQNTLAIESDYRFNIDSRNKLMAKFKFPLPEDFLKRWITATNRGNEKLSPEQLETEMPKFFEDLRWQLIKNKLISSNEIKIEQEDLLNFAKKSARIQFMQYGLNNVPEDYLDNYAKDMLNKEDQRRQYAEGAVNDKVLAFIKEAVKLDEEELTREDFNKLFEKK